MNRIKTVVIALLLSLCFASTSWAIRKFTCSSGGRTWNLTPGMWPVDVTLMVAKGSTDCDIVVDDGAGTILALGISIESGFETVTFGPLPGVPVRVTVIKSSGPNSKVYMRLSDQFRVLGTGGDSGLRDLGTAEALAREDAAYARVLERVRFYQRLKAPAGPAE